MTGFTMTRDQKRRLQAKGYGAEAISKMTPQEGHAILYPETASERLVTGQRGLGDNRVRQAAWNNSRLRLTA
jgi:hypothetical protein